MQTIRKAASSILLVAVLTFTIVGTVLANSIKGPSSSQLPYLVRSQPGVVTKAILTVCDSVDL